jgi:hypothetical protein
MLCLSHTVAVASTAALCSKLCHLKDTFVTQISALTEKGRIEIKMPLEGLGKLKKIQ